MTTLRRQLPQLALIGLLTVLFVGTPAQPQSPPVSNACQTNYGVCFVQFAVTIGSVCYCGNDQGRIVYPQQNYPVPRTSRFSDACATAYGVCRVEWAPIGSSCFCGPDPGRRI